MQEPKYIDFSNSVKNASTRKKAEVSDKAERIIDFVIATITVAIVASSPFWLPLILNKYVETGIETGIDLGQKL